MYITVQELANELGVTEDAIKVHMTELISIDGEEAVIADTRETGHHIGTYPITVVTLTDDAAEAIRTAVAAQSEIERG